MLCLVLYLKGKCQLHTARKMPIHLWGLSLASSIEWLTTGADQQMEPHSVDAYSRVLLNEAHPNISLSYIPLFLGTPPTLMIIAVHTNVTV